MTTRRWLLLGAVGASLVIAGALYGALRRDGPPAGTEIEFVVPSGAALSTISEALGGAGLVGSPFAFSLYARAKGAASDLKAGHYRLVAGMGFGEILDVLERGAVVTLPLTIPEGLTLREIAPRIAGFTGDSVALVRALLEDTAWVARKGLPGPTLEGYVFPETYRFAEGTTADAIIDEMVDRYLAFWGDAERALADSLGLDEREVVTLASIVEEEARVAAERPVIAGVYLNRLQIGMLLQADPTVQYALGEPQARLLFRHIDEVADNPYNTYTNAGLPPGPIASPGAASLRATLEPDEHDFLFFVARRDGSHEFTRTNREHVNAINRIRREPPGNRD
jgi:UPF0755 protein